MLNELYKLSKTIDDMEINAITWHREYKELPKATEKAPCFRIRISNEGSITSIDKLAQDLVPVLRKYGNNQASFPAFNIKPLYRLISNESTREDNWLKSMKKLDNSLNAIVNKFKKSLSDEVCDESITVQHLIEATQSLTKRGFRIALEEYVADAILQGKSDLIKIWEFQGKDNKNPEEDMGDNISIILDLAEWQKYGTVASDKTTMWINQALNKGTAMSDLMQVNADPDAFGEGYDMNADSEPMPDVKLPFLGPATLRSMFRGQPCQTRYNKLEDKSYPVSKLIRDTTKKALEWIASPLNKHITWIMADVDEIIFTYPSKLPKIPLEFTSIFGDTSDTERISDESRFTTQSTNFIKSFQNQPPDEKPEHIQVFSIKKMDKKRRKVVLSRNMTPDSYIDAAQKWMRGCENLPPIKIVALNIPFPLDVAKIINTVWTRDGRQSTTKRMHAYQGVEFMLDMDCDFMDYYMSILTSNIFGLISFIADNRHDAKKYKEINYHSKKIANVMAVVGLLLYRHGSLKEVYMNESAFLVGQMLKAADELHALYGKIVRNDVPSSLVGASMLVTMADMPIRAFGQLLTRMSPYLTWAKSYQHQNIADEGKESWRVRWLLGSFEKITSQLHKVLEESVRFNDYEKAQFFIGYMAAFPKRDDTKAVTTEGESENE